MTAKLTTFDIQRALDSMKNSLAALSGHLSNPATSLVRMLSGINTRVSDDVAPLLRRPILQKQVRIRRTQLELLDRYQAGALQGELAEIYGIHRATVSTIIRRYGEVRQKGLNEAQVDDAIARYGSGQSLAVIGKAMSVDHGTVRNYLLKHGVQMLDTQGRPKP